MRANAVPDTTHHRQTLTIAAQQLANLDHPTPDITNRFDAAIWFLETLGNEPTEAEQHLATLANWRDTLRRTANTPNVTQIADRRRWVNNLIDAITWAIDQTAEQRIAGATA